MVPTETLALLSFQFRVPSSKFETPPVFSGFNCIQALDSNLGRCGIVNRNSHNVAGPITGNWKLETANS